MTANATGRAHTGTADRPRAAAVITSRPRTATDNAHTGRPRDGATATITGRPHPSTAAVVTGRPRTVAVGIVTGRPRSGTRAPAPPDTGPRYTAVGTGAPSAGPGNPGRAGGRRRRPELPAVAGGGRTPSPPPPAPEHWL